MTTIKAINEKFLQGKDGLTDSELAVLMDFYATLDFSLEDIDSDFNLFKKEIRRRIDILRGFHYSRKNP